MTSIYIPHITQGGYCCNYLVYYFLLPLSEKYDYWDCDKLLPYFFLENLKTDFKKYLFCDVNIKHRKLGKHSVIVLEISCDQSYRKEIIAEINEKVISKLSTDLLSWDLSKLTKYQKLNKQKLMRENGNNFVLCNKIYQSCLSEDSQEDFNFSEISLAMSKMRIQEIHDKNTLLMTFYIGNKNSCPDIMKQKKCEYSTNILTTTFACLHPLKKNLIQETGTSVYFSASNVVYNVQDRILYSAFSTLYSLLLHEFIRDRLGLAYYAGSEFDHLNSKFIIRIGTFSPINFKKIEKEIREINKMFLERRINDSLVKQIRYAKINELLAISDEPFSFIAYNFENTLLGSESTIDADIEIIKELTPFSFYSIMRQIEFNFIITIEGMKNNETNI